MTRLVALAAVLLLCGSACGGSGSVRGGSGLVTDGRVGSLRIDVSTRSAIVAFAGKPDVAATSGSGWPGTPKYLALAYGCSDTDAAVIDDLGHKWCRTIYYVNTRTSRFVAFYSESPDFHTSNGIQPGMDQNTADDRAHQTPQGPWFAIGQYSKSANLILPSSCGKVVSGRCDGKVRAFRLESRQHPIGLLFT